MTSKLKVLEFFGEPFCYGGQEAFMLNMYKNFKNENIEYVFCTPFDLTNKNLLELSEKRKDKVVHYDYNFNSKLRKFYINKALKKILQKEKFDVIHIQTGSSFTLLTAAKLAKKYGIKNVIAHSHCTGIKNLKYKLIKKYSDKRIEKYVDNYFACSLVAGEWKFPKKIIEENKCVIVNNGININNHTFDAETRKEYRKEFGVSKNTKLLCNVGRFALQKNHKFILEIVKLLKERKFDFKFILIGEGELKQEILEKIKQINLEDCFIVLEKRNDISKIMMASDIFVMPSLFEGFPVTLIEAQATGLRCLSSNTVTQEAAISDLIEYLPIEDASVWADKIEKTKSKNTPREEYAEIVSKAGYNAEDSAKLLEDVFLSKREK